MKKSKSRAEASSRGQKSEPSKPAIPVPENKPDLNPLDKLAVKVLCLQVTDEELTPYAIKAVFNDQLIFQTVIMPIFHRTEGPIGATRNAKGYLNYDPSNYDQMCQYADIPLIVYIQGLRKGETGFFSKSSDIFGCNVDILQMFIETDELEVQRRLPPVMELPLSKRRSWCNLPMITLKLRVTRDPENARHHELLKKANFMKVTVIGAYNMLIPYDEGFNYKAATQIVTGYESHNNLVTYNQGYRKPKHFNCSNFYQKWESLRQEEYVFADSDEKLVFKLNSLVNEENIDVEYYLNKPSNNITIWGSFHRTLVLEESNRSLIKRFVRTKWPLEVHLFRDNGGYSLMGFMDLSRLSYPGVTSVRLAVPLQWFDKTRMYKNCGIEFLLAPNENVPLMSNSKVSVANNSNESILRSKDGNIIMPTGADDGPAFVIVEVRLGRQLKEDFVPKLITPTDLMKMLKEMEHNNGPQKHECTARGQQERHWQSTVSSAVAALQKVPHYGMSEFCAVSRQLSETRTRVELFTSFWQNAAVYVNNNFLPQAFLDSDKNFEELLMASHVCLMKSVCDTLVTVEKKQLDPTLRAARHARQMKDVDHAADLYMQYLNENPRDPNVWRELGTCLKDINKDWASVCVNEAIFLNPRHPLTLLSKGCLVYEEDPDAAEPFFVAILALYPFWYPGWVAASAYYWKRELYVMADQVLVYMQKSKAKGFRDDQNFVLSWESELGDWWDAAPLLPGMSYYFEAVDLLLRLRAIDLAEVCLARVLTEFGESAAYFHQVAVACYLGGDVENALCHAKRALEKYGEITYVRSLEAECHYRMHNHDGVKAAFEKSGSCIGPYSTILSLPGLPHAKPRYVLVDLLRRHPNAYAWMALADDWMKKTKLPEDGGGDINLNEEQKSARVCAIATAIQALKFDRKAGRTWALLSTLVTPSARRLFYRQMAIDCGYQFEEDRSESSSVSKQSDCHRLGWRTKQCNCDDWRLLTL